MIMLYKGYALKLTGPNSWASAPSNDWDTVVIDDLSGESMGTRLIDGSRHIVIKVGDEFCASRNYRPT